jgi:hypothetical protein
MLIAEDIVNEELKKIARDTPAISRQAKSNLIIIFPPKMLNE